MGAQRRHELRTPVHHLQVDVQPHIGQILGDRLNHRHIVQIAAPTCHEGDVETGAILFARIAGRIQQLLSLGRVVGVGHQVGVVVGRVDHARRPLALESQQRLADRRHVHRILQRHTHRRILDRPAALAVIKHRTLVEANVHAPGAGHPGHASVARVVDRLMLVRRHVGDDVHVARNQLRRPGRRLRDHLPLNFVVGHLTQREVRRLLQQHIVVLDPLDKTIGARADRVRRSILQAHRRVGILAVDVGFGDQPQRRGGVTPHHDRHFQIALDPCILILDGVEHKASRVAGEAIGVVGRPLEGVGHIFCGQRLAVMAGQPLAQLEGHLHARF